MDYIDNKQGFLRKNYKSEPSYWSFVPTPLQHVASLNLHADTVSLLCACSRKIGELEGMLRFYPGSSTYLSMTLYKEAMLSSQIEGTRCVIDDIFKQGKNETIRTSTSNVFDCEKAIEYATEQIRQSRALDMDLLNEAHQILFEKNQDQRMNPGQIRTLQNWIGFLGGTVHEALFIPPDAEDMKVLLSEMEAYITYDYATEPLIKAALIHYQFETLHPFLDGNGRIGRLLIILSLMNDGVLSGMIFCPSLSFKCRREEYYQKLMAVRERGAYYEWIIFFCECLLESVENAINAFNQMIVLERRNRELVNEHLGRSARNGQKLLELLEGNPIVDTGFVSEQLDIARTTAANLVKSFCDLGILVQPEDNRQRYRTFVYEDYLEILRQGGEPLQK